MQKAPATREVIRAFLASPGDVDAEREIVDDVIRELNTTWSAFLGLHLELLRWETHAYPGAGEYPQQLINQQISEYDIFIGIMWSRLGSPTPVAGSGTEEEFDRAYAKFLDNSESMRIMFYFKAAPPPQDADPKQIVLVSAFRKRIADIGILYWNFRDQEQFAALLRAHLSRQLQSWYRTQELRMARLLESGGALDTFRLESAVKVTHPIDDEADELVSMMQAFVDAISRFNRALDARTNELILANKHGVKHRLRVRAVVFKFTRDMDAFVGTVQPFLTRLSSSYRIVLDATSRGAPLVVDDPTVLDAWRHDLSATLRGVENSNEYLTHGLQNLLGSIAQLPAVNRSFDRPAKAMGATLRMLIVELTTIQEITRSVRVVFEFPTSPA